MICAGYVILHFFCFLFVCLFLLRIERREGQKEQRWRQNGWRRDRGRNRSREGGRERGKDGGRDINVPKLSHSFTCVTFRLHVAASHCISAPETCGGGELREQFQVSKRMKYQGFLWRWFIVSTEQAFGFRRLRWRQRTLGTSQMHAFSKKAWRACSWLHVEQCSGGSVSKKAQPSRHAQSCIQTICPKM